MYNFHFTIDKINKNKKLEKSFLKKYKNYPPKLSDVIVVFGGDGFMLQTLKKYQKYNKPFYGINRGTYGFLMKAYSSRNHNFLSLFHRKVFLIYEIFLMFEA